MQFSSVVVYHVHDGFNGVIALALTRFYRQQVLLRVRHAKSASTKFKRAGRTPLRGGFAA